MKLPNMLPWQRTLWAAVIVQTLAIVGFQAGFVLIPYYFQELGVTDLAELARWTGAYQSLGAMSFAIFTPIWGALGDHYGRKSNVIRATIGTAVLSAATGLVRTPTQLLVLRFLQGVVTGTPAASTVLVAASTPKKNIAFALGMLQTSFFIGTSVGPMIGGWIGDAIGYRQTFYFSSLIILFAVAIAIFGTQEPPREPELLREGQRRSRNPLVGFGEVFHNPVLAGLLTVNLMLSLTLSITSPAMPLLIQQIVPKGMQPASAAGMVTGVGAVTAAIAAMMISRISERIGHRRTTLLGLVGTALLYVPMGLARSVGLLGASSAAQGFFRGGIGPSLSALLVGSVRKDRTGVALGLNSSAGSVGFALGPMIGAVIVASASTRATFFVAGALCAGVCLVASFAGRRAEMTIAAEAEAET